jgi:hypothetical protein
MIDKKRLAMILAEKAKQGLIQPKQPIPGASGAIPMAPPQPGMINAPSNRMAPNAESPMMSPLPPTHKVKFSRIKKMF